MRNPVLQFYATLSSEQQKAALARYIQDAANEVMRSEQFQQMPPELCDALTGNDTQAKLDAAIRCAKRVGKKLCFPDRETEVLRVNNVEQFRNCFAVFILDGMVRGGVSDEKVYIQFCNGGAAAASYAAVIRELNGMLGGEFLCVVPSATQQQGAAHQDTFIQPNHALANDAPYPVQTEPVDTAPVAKKSKKWLIPVIIGAASTLLVVLIIVGVALVPSLIRNAAKKTMDVLEVATEEAYDDGYDDSYDEEPESDSSASAPHTLGLFDIQSASNFTAGRAWVKYSDDNGQNYALINKSGEILYRINCNKMQEMKENHEIDFSGSDTAVFDNGTAVFLSHPCYQYYTAKKHLTAGSSPSIGFILLDKDGNVFFKSEDHDDTTEYSFLTYGDGKYLVFKYQADFSSSQESVIVLDDHGNIIDEIAGVFLDGSYIGNSRFALWSYDTTKIGRIDTNIVYVYDSMQKKILNTVSGSPKFLNNTVGILNGIYYDSIGSSVIFELSGTYYCVPVSVLSSAESNEQFWENGKAIELNRKTIGSDGIYPVRADDGSYAYYDLDGRKRFSCPTFPDGTTVKDWFGFNGGYGAVSLGGVDQKPYAAVFDKTGKLLYDPVILSCPDTKHNELNQGINTIRNHYNGYIQICEHRAITPQGTVVDLNSLPDDVLSYFVGAHDGLLIKAYENNDQYKVYTDIHGNTVIGNVKLTDQTKTLE